MCVLRQERRCENQRAHPSSPADRLWVEVLRIGETRQRQRLLPCPPPCSHTLFPCPAFTHIYAFDSPRLQCPQCLWLACPPSAPKGLSSPPRTLRLPQEPECFRTTAQVLSMSTGGTAFGIPLPKDHADLVRKYPENVWMSLPSSCRAFFARAL